MFCISDAFIDGDRIRGSIHNVVDKAFESGIKMSSCRYKDHSITLDVSFEPEGGFDKCNAPDSDYGGVTYADAVRKSDRRRGVLVSFPCQKVMSMNYCCHRGSCWHGTRRRAFCLLDGLDCVLHQQCSFGCW